VLLPASSSVSYPTFLVSFVLTHMTGLISHVPGGIGIFETVMVLMLLPRLPVPAVLGSLLAYRGIYYSLPVAVASVIIAVHEMAR
jgi:uncharacterized membrane protein YbhN (UPF0104 family)